MKRVVERCPNCGVEHDDPQGGACEVCGTPLRFWCRRHGAEAGWLSEPVCPRCEAEAAAPAPPAPEPRRHRPEPRRRSAPVRVPGGAADPARRPRGAGRDPRIVIRGGAEELGPYVVTGAGLAFRLLRAIFALLRATIFWGLLGGLVGGGVAFYQGGDPIWSGLFGAMVGGCAGLLFGAVAAIRILFTPPAPPRR